MFSDYKVQIQKLQCFIFIIRITCIVMFSGSLLEKWLYCINTFEKVSKKEVKEICINLIVHKIVVVEVNITTL